MKILILRVENGEVKEKSVVEGDMHSVLKNTVVKALDYWDPTKSDLVVMRHSHEIQVQLPLTKEQYELYSRFNLRRLGDRAAFTIPLYIVSYENEWRGEELVDTKIFVVSPYIDERVEEEVTRLAMTITSYESEEE